MATVTRGKLSGLIDGRPVSKYWPSGLTVLHTAINGTTDWDEIWVYCCNLSTHTVGEVLFKWGGVTDPDDYIYLNMRSLQQWTCVIPGLCLNNGVELGISYNKGWIGIWGFVNQIRN